MDKQILRILVKAGTPPDDRLNQVRNDRLILHHCYLNLNVSRIIRQIFNPTGKLANYLRWIETTLAHNLQQSAPPQVRCGRSERCDRHAPSLESGQLETVLDDYE